MKLSIKSLLTATHKVSTSAALCVLAGSLSLSAPLAAKEKSAEKSPTAKHATQKQLATKKSARVTRVKSTKSHRKVAKESGKKDAKQTSKKLEKTRKLIDRNKNSYKTGKLKPTSLVKPDKQNRHTKRNRHQAANPVPSSFEWNPSSEPRQAYYLIPPLGGAIQANQPEQQAPQPASARPLHVGTASYYSDKFDGGKTASGERFDQDKLTCAHGSLPFGCKIRVTNLNNNKSVDVKVNDRGGFSKHGRVVDLSKAAAKEIGMVGTGTAKVKVEVLE